MLTQFAFERQIAKFAQLRRQPIKLWHRGIQVPTPPRLGTNGWRRSASLCRVSLPCALCLVTRFRARCCGSEADNIFLNAIRQWYLYRLSTLSQPKPSITSLTSSRFLRPETTRAANLTSFCSRPRWVALLAPYTDRQYRRTENTRPWTSVTSTDWGDFACCGSAHTRNQYNGAPRRLCEWQSLCRYQTRHLSFWQSWCTRLSIRKRSRGSVEDAVQVRGCRAQWAESSPR